MSTLRRSIELPVPAAEAFAWHERPGALERLTPPWAALDVAQAPSTLAVGTEVILQAGVGPLRTRWTAEHVTYDPPHEFRDVLRHGPFAAWDHRHLFADTGEDTSTLTDVVTYRLPFGPLGETVAGRRVAHELERVFAFRHRRLAADLAVHARLTQTPLKVAISGASGLIGGALSSFLRTGGHDVVAMVRPGSSRDGIRWDPQGGTVDTEALRDVDAVVHVAAEPIEARPMTAEKRRRIRDSRVEGTRTIATALAAMDDGPRVLVSASGSNIYGDRGDEELTESAPPGTGGFLCEVARDWESALQPARDAGLRVVIMRNGIVLDRKATILRALGSVTRLGAAAPVGTGRQYWPWVSIDDLVAMYLLAVVSDDLEGPINACAPQAVTNEEFTRALAGVLRRPVWPLRVPKPAPALLLGREMADSLLFTSMRMVPARLQALGYPFLHPTLEDALRHLYGR